MRPPSVRGLKAPPRGPGGWGNGAQQSRPALMKRDRVVPPAYKRRRPACRPAARRAHGLECMEAEPQRQREQRERASSRCPSGRSQRQLVMSTRPLVAAHAHAAVHALSRQEPPGNPPPGVPGGPTKPPCWSRRTRKAVCGPWLTGGVSAVAGSAEQPSASERREKAGPARPSREAQQLQP